MGNSLSIVLTYRLHKETESKTAYNLLKRKCIKNNMCNNVSNGKYFIEVMSHVKLPFQDI